MTTFAKRKAFSGAFLRAKHDKRMDEARMLLAIVRNIDKQREDGEAKR